MPGLDWKDKSLPIIGHTLGKIKPNIHFIVASWSSGAIILSLQVIKLSNMMQNHACELSSLLTTTKRLRKQISKVVMSINIRRSPFISGNTFTDEMVSDGARLLLQNREWSCRIR